MFTSLCLSINTNSLFDTNPSVDDSKIAQIFTSLCICYSVLFTYLSSPPTYKLTEDKDISITVALKV